MSFIIDRYVLDVLDRILQSHGIPFLGMTASIIPNHVMFMDRGVLIPVRKPLVHDIELARKQIVNDTFTPSYVSVVNKYNRRRYWKTFLAFQLRGIMYQGLRHIKRDPLNLHYLDALNHLEHKPRWSDYVVLNAMNHDWESILLATAYNKRVFIGLQLLPEASLDYWLPELALLDNEKVILEICEVLSQAGFTLFVKDHPLQFGFRKKDLIQKLASLPNIVLIPYSAPATRLIKDCAITVTMTGTIGFQSAVAGACSIVGGAYYSDETHFIQMRHPDDIKALPAKISKFQQTHVETITTESIDGLLSTILAASAPGDLFSFKQFNHNKSSHTQNTATLISSLNLYLPQFLKDNKKLA